MKKICIILIMMTGALATSCYRSQFPTTTRHYKNGKVNYVNHYHPEKSKVKTVKSPKTIQEQTTTMEISPGFDLTKTQGNPDPGIVKVNPLVIPVTSGLIASNSMKPDFIVLTKDNVMSKQEMSFPSTGSLRPATAHPYSDTVVNKKSQEGKTPDVSDQRIIKYKNGQKETVRIISRSGDTLKFQLVSEKGITRTVMMEQVDSILPVPPPKAEKNMEKAGGTRKTERLGKQGFVFSILGFIPGLGIIFSLLAIIFGAISLQRINRNPEKYNGKKYANRSLVIGIVALVVNIALVALIIGMAVSDMNSGIGGGF